MTKSPVWKEIAATIREELARGHYPAGSKLPSEARFAARFGVNRHTVRHALADLAAQGLVHARRGAGVFVTGRATDYPLGRRVRFHQAISAAGQEPRKELTRVETRACDAQEAEALQISPGDPVHVVEGRSFADAEVLAAFRSLFPARLLPDLPAALAGEASVTRALALCGIADFTRASTRLTARTAAPVLALQLQLKEGAPVLRSVSLNIDASGRVIEYGTTWFAGERVTLTVAPETAAAETAAPETAV